MLKRFAEDSSCSSWESLRNQNLSDVSLVISQCEMIFCRIIARFCVTLFLHSIEVFNKQAIQPRNFHPTCLYLASLRCRRRLCPLFLPFPRHLRPSFTLDTNTEISRKILRDMLRVYADAPVAQKLSDILFHSAKNSLRWPTFDVEH